MKTSEIIERLRKSCDDCDDPEECLGACRTEAQIRDLGAMCILEDYERKNYICTNRACEAYQYCLSGADGLGICDSAFADSTYKSLREYRAERNTPLPRGE